jgi:hypothetical protein
VKPVRTAVFLIHLVQDVNVLRPLIFMASRDFGFDTLLLVSTKFMARDGFGIWRQELELICAESGARTEFFDDDWEAHGHLVGEGLLFSASESHLHNHSVTHDVFRHAPPGYLKVTLQHGFECVGFRHSADHIRAHGETVSFGADIVCSWTDGARLPSMALSQRGKLLVTGPPAVLQMPTQNFHRDPGAPGIVCENLHSVRFKGGGNFKSEFIATFSQFSRRMAKRKREVLLRAHPGGQYFLRNKVPLPANVRIENAPLYRLDLRQFSYGISAPSSVLIDMLLAKIPTAVWCDRRGNMDASSYKGLAIVSSARDWERFARAAEADPEPFLRRQEGFLHETGMPLEPRDVFLRFAQLFQTAQRMEVRRPGSVAERERILFIADDDIPGIREAFEKPLEPLVARGEIATGLLTQEQLRAECGSLGECGSLERELNAFTPSVIVFGRYSGSAYRTALDWARREKVPVIYLIDDDGLFSPSGDLDELEDATRGPPEREQSVSEMLRTADLVYASTPKLKSRLLSDFPHLPIVTGDLYCPSSLLRAPSRARATKIGYITGTDRSHNLAMVIEAIEKLLERNPHLRFEIFGSTSVPDQLLRFGDRITTAPPIANRESFLDDLAKSEWDIGICPLAPGIKQDDAKWAEYTSIAAAVVASRGTAYEECCADGCGILAHGAEEWFSALDLLVNNVDERVATVERAQAKLEQQYSIAHLREQVLNLIARAHSAVSANPRENQEKKEVSVCQIR